MAKRRTSDANREAARTSAVGPISKALLRALAVLFVITLSVVIAEPFFMLLPRLTSSTSAHGGAVAALSSGGLAGLTHALPASAGPEAPILIITASSEPFSAYYPEILHADGLNEFAVADLSAVSAAMLSDYKVALLDDVKLTPKGVRG
jgi:hypothetical protein